PVLEHISTQAESVVSSSGINLDEIAESTTESSATFLDKNEIHFEQTATTVQNVGKLDVARNTTDDIELITDDIKPSNDQVPNLEKSKSVVKKTSKPSNKGKSILPTQNRYENSISNKDHLQDIYYLLSQKPDCPIRDEDWEKCLDE